MKEMRRAVELDDANGVAHEQLALLLYRQGDFGGAMRAGFERPWDVMERLKRGR